MDGDGTVTAHIRVDRLMKSFTLSARPAVSSLEIVRGGARTDQQLKTIHAVDNLSFEVREGERVGIIGRNGAGKTSLLSILAGISQPSSGEMRVTGEVHAILAIGAVLRDEETGRQNIFLDGAVHGRSSDAVNARVAEIIEFTELGEFIDRPVRTYSSGMKARLAFAMGVFIDPDILIIDETLSVGDAFFATKARKKIRELTDRGRIVLMVSHALESIVQMCSRCLWLEGGRLMMDGEPKVVTAAYQAAVQQADELELRKKFAAPPRLSKRHDAGKIGGMELVQKGISTAATVRCTVALTVLVVCSLQTRSAVEIDMTITRVDGQLMWRQTFAAGVVSGGFRMSIDMDPFLFGAGLYRVDAVLRDGVGVVDFQSRVFETIDDEGQCGGVPMLLYPPKITSRKIGSAR
jgi:lipopolysaccharide transport system ATP-binding protein